MRNEMQKKYTLLELWKRSKIRDGKRFLLMGSNAQKLQIGNSIASDSQIIIINSDF